MRKTAVVFFSVFALAIGTITGQKSNLEIPPKTTMEVDYADYGLYKLYLKNNNSKGLEVKVVDKKTGAFVRGFGLGPLGKVDVMVEASSKIMFMNSSAKVARLSIRVEAMDAKKVAEGNKGLISFTLVNPSADPIPLIIPNVMNPNLSPNSRSGVDLALGQELIFRHKGKRHVLFTVDGTIEKGQEIDVYQLLEKRKKELGLK